MNNAVDKQECIAFRQVEFNRALQLVHSISQAVIADIGVRKI